MNDSKLKVLLYSDGSHQAFSAAVYAARLLKKSPNMQLTILQIKETDKGSLGVKYNWLELRAKYKRYHWECSIDTDFNWLDIWPVTPDSKWIKHAFESDSATQKKYTEILKKTNNIFTERKENVHSQKLCLNISFSEKADKSETVEMIVDYAAQKSFDLIIMGTRGLSKLYGLIFSSLAHDVLNKSPIPVLLIKKLTKEFIDSYLID